MIYGLGPLIALIYALCTGKTRRLSTLLAGVTLLAQIDAKRCFDREHELPIPWSLTAPLGWAIFGVMVLDVARLILTGHGASWKGRQIHIPSHISKQCPSVSGASDVLQQEETADQPSAPDIDTEMAS